MKKNLKQVKEAYIEHGLNGYKLSTYDDLAKIHGVDIEKMKGFKKFDEKSKAFLKTFLVNFFNAQGVETRIAIEPISFTHHKVNAKPQIKFTLKKRGAVEYYFVAGVNAWY